MIVIFLTQRVFAGIIAFGSVGTAVAILIYRNFKNIEYYYYLNGGLTKKQLILNSLKYNFIISSLLSILLWIIH